MLSTSVMGLSACSPAPQDSSVVQQQQASQLLAATFEEYSHALMALEPMRATFRGQHQYNDQLPNIFSAEHRERRRLLEEEYLAVLNRINPELLNADDRLSYRIFRYEREMELARMAHPEHLMPLNQFYNMTNTWAMLGSGTSAQPFRDVRDYENWAARMERIPVLIDEMITNMNEGIAQGVTQPRVLMERVQTQIAAHLVDDLQESLFMRPILSFPEGVSEADQVRLAERYETLLSETVLPAYQRLFDYLERDYIPASRTGSYGIGSLPGGQAWYQFLVQWHTTTPMTVTEVHEVGLAEVERIQSAIQAVMDEVEFEGSMEAFFVFTRDDPQFHYSSREEMLEDYRAFAAKVDAVSDRLFFPEMLPQADYEIRKVERFRERSASSGSYSRPSEDGSRPGIFYLNTYDLPSRPTWAKGALTLHEAVPGHHYQIALQQELTHLPDFRRFGSITAYIEGWGLYSESLGDELGVYDAYDRYGALIAELWRAIRLVVDTGIHAKGWSRQEVLDYMAANAPVGEARRVSEAERFMALPGQALAYKIGQLHIQSLRDRAEAALGEGFDVREFHRQVLKNGSLPLAILEEEIDAWIAREM
ncbi:DUF885 domain-containing protein [Aliidiomarina sanyensis]|uniref:DUF885 domain-containing protein n=2 Tax=Aliidiomarina sanyensis TaxID=1249555 RepID=A0A432WSB2_9GAMM|nr:DUF885 domain-containing protein [Aliidiomarina sanyensis]